MFWKVTVYTSPVILGYLYHKGYFEPEGLVTLTKFVKSVGFILVISFCIQGLSRANNPVYRNFLTTLQSAQKNMSLEVKQQLNKYDFDFQSWPVEFENSRERM